MMECSCTLEGAYAGLETSQLMSLRWQISESVSMSLLKLFTLL
jgi:hypothetical protein